LWVLFLLDGAEPPDITMLNATTKLLGLRTPTAHCYNNNNNNNKYSGTYRGKTKKGLDKRGNKRSDMVLYVLQTAFYNRKT